MIVNIEGKSKNLEHGDIEDIVHFTMNNIMPNSNDIVIDIEFIDSIESFVGFCEVNECDTKNPRYFNIILSADTERDEEMKTLIHELVHVKQYATGELVDIVEENSVEWKGGIYADPYNENFTVDEIRKFPWEAEAYAKEEHLYLRYMMEKI